MTLAAYFQEPAADTPAMGRAAHEAHALLSEAGLVADRMLVTAERTKAGLSRAEEASFEETVQTLGALSREAWAGADAALKVTRILHQLLEVEARLRDHIEGAA